MITLMLRSAISALPCYVDHRRSAARMSLALPVALALRCVPPARAALDDAPRGVCGYLGCSLAAQHVASGDDPLLVCACAHVFIGCVMLVLVVVGECGAVRGTQSFNLRQPSNCHACFRAVYSV